MKQKLYIHIGFPKTGTTTIQNFFYFNREKNKRNGIYYPTPVQRKGVEGNSHQSISASDYRTLYDNTPISVFLDIYKKDMLSCKCDINILSAETLVYDNPQNLSSLRECFDIKIICAFRNIFDSTISLQKQIIRDGLRQEIFQLAASRNNLVLSRVESYVNFFGCENCFFLNYDKIKNTGSILNEFLKILGVGISFENNSKRSNKTPSDVVNMFLFQLSFLPISFVEWKNIRNELIGLDVSPWKDFICTLMPSSFFQLDQVCHKAIQRQGQLLNDSSWHDYTLLRGKILESIPNHDLPKDVQHYIFRNLSKSAQNTIIRYWPLAGKAKSNDAILPSLENIPTESFELLTRLRSAYLEASKKIFTVLREKDVIFEQIKGEKNKDYKKRIMQRNLLLNQHRHLLLRIYDCFVPLVNNLARQAYDIRRSGLFDIGWYLERYPDVAEAGIDPVVHYVRFGAKEGRDPAPWFSTSAYLQANPDVAASGVNPFYHYIRHGVAEGRASYEAHC